MTNQHPKMILDSKYKHPLTYEIANEIYPHDSNGHEYYCGDWHQHMQAGANWQLEQVIKFMEEHEQLFGGSGMIFILKDAMRPQQQEDN